LQERLKNTFPMELWLKMQNVKSVVQTK
jgi:hypothetical protein